MNLLPLSRNDSHSTESRNNSKSQQLAGGAGWWSRSHLQSPAWTLGLVLLSCRWESHPHELRDFSKGKTAVHSGRSNGLRRVQSHGLALPGAPLHSRVSNVPAVCQVGWFPPVPRKRNACGAVLCFHRDFRSSVLLAWNTLYKGLRAVTSETHLQTFWSIKTLQGQWGWESLGACVGQIVSAWTRSIKILESNCFIV